jgi:hypothetical protein
VRRGRALDGGTVVSAVETVTTLLTCDVCGLIVSMRATRTHAARAQAHLKGWRRGVHGTDRCDACEAKRRAALGKSEAGRSLARVEARVRA